MKVLVTGGLGGIGSVVSKKLVEKGHDVIVFDLKNKRNQNTARDQKYKVFWGDMRNFNELQDAVKNVDVVIHMAFVLQPFSEIDTVFSRAVNVGGTEKLIKAINEENPNIKMIFISSTTIYGITNNETPPIKLNHPIRPVVEYSKHKVECEKIVKKSIKNYVILRFSEVGHFKIGSTDFNYIYRLPVDQRTEFVHVDDAASAVINSVTLFDKINKETFIISGGKQNQTINYERFRIVFKNSYGLNPPPKSKFSKKPYPFDWYDSSKSQKILSYQSKTIYDFAEDIKNNFPYNPQLIRFFAPIIELFLYNKLFSPIYNLILDYYDQNKR